jgi:hypothetical protein
MAGVVCGHCGAVNPEGRQFCQNCDEFLDWEGTPAEPDPRGTPAPARPGSRPTGAPVPSTTSAPSSAPSSAPTSASAPVPSTAVQTSPVAPSPVARAAPSASPVPRPASPPGPSAAPPAPIEPSAATCPRCGTQNDTARRFCRHCGEWLVVHTPVPAVRGRSSGRRRRWWQRGEAYSRSLTPSTVAFRILAVVASIAALVVILTLSGLHPIRQVTDFIGHVRGSGRLDGVTAAAQPDDPLSGHTAPWAIDDQRDRGWTTRWTASDAGNPGAACNSASATGGAQPPASATANTLVLTFPAATDVREVGIEAGAVGADERTNRWQPKTLELRWNGGGCQRVDLANVPGLQRFGVDQGAVRGVTIVVVAGYAPANAGSDRLDIGEVTFWQR